MTSHNHHETRKPSRTVRFSRAVSLKLLLPLAVVLLAVLGAKILIDTAPTSPRKHQEKQAKLVDVITVTPRPYTIRIEAMGSTSPSRQVQIKSQVAGRIDWLSDQLIPGGDFHAGQAMVGIERKDYELAVRQRESELKTAEAAVLEAGRQLVYARRDLKLEMGSQQVALREYELLESQVEQSNRDLVLRKPQLEAAEAMLEAAEAAVESAKASLDAAAARLEDATLDLERTTVTAPFNAIVLEKRVELGDVVGSTTPLADIIGTDTFWIRLAVPEQMLTWITLPASETGAGSAVRVHNAGWPEGHTRTGRVLRRLPAVERQGRMAWVLVAVDDPLALEPANADLPTLLANTYIRAEILGRSFENAIVLPRDLVRAGDKVWLAGDDDTLIIRKVDILYRGRDEVMIRAGLKPGERIITTDLAAPIEGMTLRFNQ